MAGQKFGYQIKVLLFLQKCTWVRNQQRTFSLGWRCSKKVYIFTNIYQSHWAQQINHLTQFCMFQLCIGYIGTAVLRGVSKSGWWRKPAHKIQIKVERQIKLSSRGGFSSSKAGSATVHVRCFPHTIHILYLRDPYKTPVKEPRIMILLFRAASAIWSNPHVCHLWWAHLEKRILLLGCLLGCSRQCENTAEKILLCPRRCVTVLFRSAPASTPPKLQSGRIFTLSR